MKRHFFLSLSILAAFLFSATGCTKDDRLLEPDAPAAEGKYRLASITASLEDGDASSKTTLVRNTKVLWNAGDRIAVKGSGNTLYQYELSEGSGSSIGRFTPVETGVCASYDDADDLIAVYPASAATISGSTIKISINSLTQARASTYGLTWSPDAPYSFSNNDVKAARGTGTGNDEKGVNFKFTQLATYCEFTIDVTQALDKDIYTTEKLDKLTVSVSGKNISGTATLDVSGDTPALSAGNATSISREWVDDPVSLSEAVTVGFILYPQVTTSDVITITARTSARTFTFTGSPAKDLTAGTSLKFPIVVDRNFNPESALQYTETYNGFVYYGGTNCMLIKPGETTGSLDVTPYVTNIEHFKNTKTPASGEPSAQSAKVIWREGPLSISSLAISGSKLTVYLSGDSGYGNALVGIYDSDDNLLWSYHIWHPEDDPTQTLTYPVTKSGSYDVMPMYLGATKIVYATYDDSEMESMTDEEKAAYVLEKKAKGTGLYYQWGRKDPLGRAGSLSEYVFTAIYTSNSGVETPVSFPAAVTSSAAISGGGSSGANFVKAIKYTIKNPSVFVTQGSINYDWAGGGTNHKHLWGNPTGNIVVTSGNVNVNVGASTFPSISFTYKSIFDPSPEGYRIAPADLWINNLTYSDFYEGRTLYYDGTNGDFYVACGTLFRESGAFRQVGLNATCLSSSSYNGVDGSALLIDSETVTPMADLTHSNAITVRCVKE